MRLPLLNCASSLARVVLGCHHGLKAWLRGDSITLSVLPILVQRILSRDIEDEITHHYIPTESVGNNYLCLLNIWLKYFS
jgi:hypothetical protein